MTSGDRETTYQKRARERTELEMRRGAEIVEKNVNAQALPLAKHFLAKEFDPTYVATDPNLPNGAISPEERNRRNDYRDRLALRNGGQNQ